MADADSVSRISGGPELLRRLERIEKRLEEMTGEMRRLERLEERLITHHDALAHVGKRLDGIDRSIDTLDKVQAGAALPMRWIQAIFGALILGALGLFAQALLPLLSRGH